MGVTTLEKKLEKNKSALDKERSAKNQFRKEIRKLREIATLRDVECAMVEARWVLEDVIATHFEPKETNLESINSIEGACTLCGALHYLREAGNCACHIRNLQKFRSGESSQFDLETIGFMFKIISKEIPTYSPGFDSRFWKQFT